MLHGPKNPPFWKDRIVKPEEVLEKIKPGMLVVGLSVHGHFWELIVGSTGEAIIERSPCPVLVIPS